MGNPSGKELLDNLPINICFCRIMYEKSLMRYAQKSNRLNIKTFVMKIISRKIILIPRDHITNRPNDDHEK